MALAQKNAAEERPSLASLPDDLKKEILYRLDFDKKARVSTVCKDFYRLLVAAADPNMYDSGTFTFKFAAGELQGPLLKTEIKLDPRFRLSVPHLIVSTDFGPCALGTGPDPSAAALPFLRGGRWRRFGAVVLALPSISARALGIVRGVARMLSDESYPKTLGIKVVDHTMSYQPHDLDALSDLVGSFPTLGFELELSALNFFDADESPLLVAALQRLLGQPNLRRIESLVMPHLSRSDIDYRALLSPARHIGMIYPSVKIGLNPEEGIWQLLQLTGIQSLYGLEWRCGFGCRLPRLSDTELGILTSAFTQLTRLDLGLSTISAREVDRAGSALEPLRSLRRVTLSFDMVQDGAGSKDRDNSEDLRRSGFSLSSVPPLRLPPRVEWLKAHFWISWGAAYPQCLDMFQNMQSVRDLRLLIEVQPSYDRRGWTDAALEIQLGPSLSALGSLTMLTIRADRELMATFPDCASRLSALREVNMTIPYAMRYAARSDWPRPHPRIAPAEAKSDEGSKSRWGSDEDEDDFRGTVRFLWL